MTNKNHKVLVTENYSNYFPPIAVTELVCDLLSGIPSKYLNGLHAVVLNSSTALNRYGRRKKTLTQRRKVAFSKCLGVYHQKNQGRPASIHLYVDQIIEERPKWMLRLLFFRRMIFADVLFHELGHHIHYTIAPEYKEIENVAEVWRKQLTKEYVANRYGYLKPFKPLIRIVEQL